MNETDKVILSELKDRIAKHLPLWKMFLFGSRARGDAEPDSDMDVIVILNEPVETSTDRLVSEDAWEVGLGRGLVISPVVFSRKEWEEGPERFSLLALAVQREGVAV